jgi:hypothetical protein
MTMQLRITTLKDKAATTVRVEGGLDRANVSQLVAEVEAAAVPVVLDCGPPTPPPCTSCRS